MAQFQIGSKVIETNSGKHGTVVGVDPYRRGRQTYKVCHIVIVEGLLLA